MTLPRLLVLWDVDHTLVQSGGVGREMYQRAMSAAFDRSFVKLADVSGRTELKIMAETLELHGVEATAANVERLAQALTSSYEAAREELAVRGAALPGVRKALFALKNEQAVHQAVLTGNLRLVARVKLEVFGLDHFLDLEGSAYGDDHSDRAKLVAIAQQRSGERTGGTFGGVNTVLIGDTPRDVEAALEAGVRVIAVASGRNSVEELRAAGAEQVLAGLTDLGALVEKLRIGI